MFWIAIAAQLSAPVPTNLNDWFYVDDVPQYLIKREHGVWLVSVRVTVAPDGKVQKCQPEASSGIPELDLYTCSTLSRRAKFRAARWDDGTSAFGVHRTVVTWAVSDSPRSMPDLAKISLPDIELSVLILPPCIMSPALTRVMFKVDEQGRISSCVGEPFKTLQRVENDPRLISIACEQIAQKYRPIPAKDATGMAVSSVQDATVRFSTTPS